MHCCKSPEEGFRHASGTWLTGSVRDSGEHCEGMHAELCS